MPGQPTKQGNWGDWATIHSDATDSIQRQNDEFTAPLNINQLKRLPGIECAYAKNISDQIILCQNGRSQYSGGKCPGKCPLYKEDWSHVNALIEDKPHHMCAYCNRSGDIYTCLYHHKQTTRCSECKAPNQNFKESIEKREKSPNALPISNMGTPKEKLQDVTQFFSAHNVYVKTTKSCPSCHSKFKCGIGKICMNGRKSVYKGIVYFVCPVCRRLFMNQSNIDVLRKSCIVAKVIP